MSRCALVLAMGTTLSLSACRTPSPRIAAIDPVSYALGTIGGFSELVNAGVKTLALSEVLPSGDMDRLFPDAQRVAERHRVQLFREADLLVTDLFPTDVATGREVLVMHQGTAKEEYLRLKSDKAALGGDVYFGSDFLVLLEILQTAFQAVLKGISQCDELHVGVSAQRLRRRTRASPSTANQANSQHITPGRMHSSLQGQIRRQRGAGQRG